MINDKIKCCSLLESFVNQYRKTLRMELIELGGTYVLEIGGLLHVDDAPSGMANDCGSGCISCGPATPKGEPWHTVPLDTVWKVCPFCGANFVKQGPS